MQNPRTFTVRLLAAFALAGSILALGPPPKPSPEVCAERQQIDEAWARAVGLSALPGAEAVVRPAHIRIVYESRWYPSGPAQITRLCGRTELYLLPDDSTPNANDFTVHADVSAFVPPGDCKLLRAVLTHEFLHVIRAFVNNGPTPNDEAWVRSLVPDACH